MVVVEADDVVVVVVVDVVDVVVVGRDVVVVVVLVVVLVLVVVSERPRMSPTEVALFDAVPVVTVDSGLPMDSSMMVTTPREMAKTSATTATTGQRGPFLFGALRSGAGAGRAGSMPPRRWPSSTDTL